MKNLQIDYMEVSMIKCLSTVFAFSFAFNSFTVNYCVEVRNDTDQPFKIVTVGLERSRTLFEKTVISSVWYGAKEIENEEEIPANTKKRLFVTLDQDDHENKSDFFVLQNHRGSFYVNFGKKSDSCRISLPVLTEDQTEDILSRYPDFGENAVISKSKVYKAERTSSRREGAEIIKITKNQ